MPHWRRGRPPAEPVLLPPGIASGLSALPIRGLLGLLAASGVATSLSGEQSREVATECLDGGPLLYANFRKRIWVPMLERLGLPPVTPHSARHWFTLQAQGIEVGLVAKLAGHASAVVTLGHYTQAVRGGESAVAALERAFTTGPLSDATQQAP